MPGKPKRAFDTKVLEIRYCYIKNNLKQLSQTIFECGFSDPITMCHVVKCYPIVIRSPKTHFNARCKEGQKSNQMWWQWVMEKEPRKCQVTLIRTTCATHHPFFSIQHEKDFKKHPFVKFINFAQCLQIFVFKKSLFSELVFTDNGQEGFRN